MDSLNAYWLTRLLLAAWAVCACAASAPAAMPGTNAAAASLRASYAALGEQLSHNQFARPLYLESDESPGEVKGDIYALIDHPFAAVNAALNGPAHWCDVLILHLNTKYCRASTDNAGTTLTVRIGNKKAQALDDAHRFEFVYRVASSAPDYFAVELTAPAGPLGTSNYRILLEAVAIEGGRTFLHLTYSYSYSLAGRLAMQTYLATAGSGKVGFTIAGRKSDGQPEYIRGVRGVVERNTMRYYLAIDAYLAALAAPPSERLERRLQFWFNATEQYPRQLHELDRAAYLAMKRNEYLRQQTL